MAGYGDEISTISLGSIIGGALNAIVEAQSQAANTTVNYIESVGFETDKETNGKKPVYVDFEYEKKKKMDEGENPVSTEITKMKVPLLTMLPIPFIRVDDATIDFNVKINSVEEAKTSDDSKWGANTTATANYNGWRFKAGIKLNASISNQKKSSTSDTVKRDYSLNVRVHVVQDDMPAGVEHLLSVLQDSISVKEETVKVATMDTGDETE